MALLSYSTHWFGLSPTLLVVIVMSTLCCNCHCHHVGLHSSSLCWGALFLLPPCIGLGCTRPHVGLGHNPPPPPSCWLGFNSSTLAPIRRTTLIALVVNLPHPHPHCLCPSRSLRVRWLPFHQGQGGCHCSHIHEPSFLHVYRHWVLLVHLYMPLLYINSRPYPNILHISTVELAHHPKKKRFRCGAGLDQLTNMVLWVSR